MRSPLAPELVPATVETKSLFAMSIFEPGNPVGQAIFQEFLPQALNSGQFVPQPEAEVVGKGVSALQDAMERHKAGVSAKKIVVTAE